MAQLFLVWSWRWVPCTEGGGHWIVSVYVRPLHCGLHSAHCSCSAIWSDGAAWWQFVLRIYVAGGGRRFILCVITTENVSPFVTLHWHTNYEATLYLLLNSGSYYCHKGPTHESPHCTVSMLPCFLEALFSLLTLVDKLSRQVTLLASKRIRFCRQLGLLGPLDWRGYGKDCDMLLNIMCSPPLQPLSWDPAPQHWQRLSAWLFISSLGD